MARPAQVIIHDGDDWVEVFIDGVEFTNLCSNHRMCEADFVAILKKLGHKAEVIVGEFDENGDFVPEQ